MHREMQILYTTPTFLYFVMLKIGIVGLPNVGKSTLFNALTRSHSAEAANYPFCTIDPNVGVVAVPDARQDRLATLHPSEKIVPTAIEFVDIAGLVAGASEGQGLGNKFLAHIREVDAIAQVVRDFTDPDIQHVAASPNPQDDISTIETELILADLATMERKVGEAQKRTKSGDTKLKMIADIMVEIQAALSDGRPARSVLLPDEPEVRLAIRDCHLLTSKPLLYVVNVGEREVATFDAVRWRQKAGIADSSEVVPVSARLESELIDLSPEDAAVFLADIGLTESSCHGLIWAAYRLLGLITFFTVGPMECRAWTVSTGSRAPQAAGVIHTDFEKGFIRSETVQWDKLLEAGSEAAAKERGWIRSEGKDYIVQDGDVCLFRFNG